MVRHSGKYGDALGVNPQPDSCGGGEFEQRRCHAAFGGVVHRVYINRVAGYRRGFRDADAGCEEEGLRALDYGRGHAICSEGVPCLACEN